MQTLSQAAFETLHTLEDTAKRILLIKSAKQAYSATSLGTALSRCSRLSCCCFWCWASCLASSEPPENVKCTESVAGIVKESVTSGIRGGVSAPVRDIRG